MPQQLHGLFCMPEKIMFFTVCFLFFVCSFFACKKKEHALEEHVCVYVCVCMCVYVSHISVCARERVSVRGLMIP